MSQKVLDLYSVEEFEDLLFSAEQKKKSVWAEKFVEDLREKFEEYGESMFISDRQVEMLQKIIGE